MRAGRPLMKPNWIALRTPSRNMLPIHFTSAGFGSKRIQCEAANHVQEDHAGGLGVNGWLRFLGEHADVARVHRSRSPVRRKTLTAWQGPQQLGVAAPCACHFPVLAHTTASRPRDGNA